MFEYVGLVTNHIRTVPLRLSRTRVENKIWDIFIQRKLMDTTTPVLRLMHIIRQHEKNHYRLLEIEINDKNFNSNE